MIIQLKYIPQIDTFRFFAVLLVIISHWLPGSSINRIPNGFLGVTFFFVLSGFLITTNLLSSKQLIKSGKLEKGKAIKFFYIRRTLRIFPLYYLVTLIIFYLNNNIFEGNVLWYIFYLPNFLVFYQQHWSGMLSHFWSLGVEEQYYLIWPFLIFFTNDKYLKYLFSGIITISLFSKLYFYFYTNIYNSSLPTSCFDAFGIGASLALFISRNKEYKFNADIKLGLIFFFISLLSIIIYLVGYIFLFGLLISINSAIIIYKATNGFRGIFGKILNQPILIYLGKISYGIYIYHNFVPWLMRCIMGKETLYQINNITFPLNWLNYHPIVLLEIEFMLVIIISSLSWFLFERPILNLKKNYKQEVSQPMNKRFNDIIQQDELL